MKQKSRPTTLALGTISEGTLRPEDLIPAVADELARLRLTRAERAIVREAERWIPAESDDVAERQADPADLYDELTQIADAHCPAWSYFGSLEGDGACIGVWPIVPTEPDDDVFRCSELPDGPAPNGESYALVVSDHGNATLYARGRRGWREIWGVV